MTSPDKNKRICVGKITAAHGVKGLVKILPNCEELSLLEGSLFTSDDPQDTNTLTIKLKNPSGKYVLAQIDEITSPEEVQNHKCSLYVPRETLPKIENENEFYVEDLIGLTAKTHDHGDILGIIKNVDNFGAGDLLEIKPNDGKATYYIPFHDDYIGDIDINKQYVSIKNSELFRSMETK